MSKSISTLNLKSILILHRNEALCEALSFSLRKEGFIVDISHTAEAALKLDLADYALIITDITLAGMSGFDFIHALKSNFETSHTPVIICSALNSDNDIIEGLNIGADDYIAQPFSTRVAVARIKAVIRRTSERTTRRNITFGTLDLDLDLKTCTLAGRAIKMPRKEFEILALLITHRGRIFTREEILSQIWPNQVVVLDRVVDVNITRLRSKIGSYGRHIITRSGYGYGFED